MFDLNLGYFATQPDAERACAVEVVVSVARSPRTGAKTADRAPTAIRRLADLGVPFNRTLEGFRDQRRFGGTLFKRTSFAGATTGQQLLYSLDEQVRRWEVAGKVTKYEGWEMLSLVMDDHQVCRGLVAMNLQTLELRSFVADAVIMATGGPGLLFGRSTNSVINSGAAAAIALITGSSR